MLSQKCHITCNVVVGAYIKLQHCKWWALSKTENLRAKMLASLPLLSSASVHYTNSSQHELAADCIDNVHTVQYQMDAGFLRNPSQLCHTEPTARRPLIHCTVVQHIAWQQHLANAREDDVTKAESIGLIEHRRLHSAAVRVGVL